MSGFPGEKMEGLKMIFATINDNSMLFSTWKQFHAATFSPDSRPDYVTDFRNSGADYQSRKEAARTLAIEFQSNDRGGLTWSEYNLICNLFEKLGKRYGLLTEYRENGLL